MKNIKNESFDAGRAGQGQINLQNGQIEFVHNDTGTDSSVLPINVCHVYSSKLVANSENAATFGKGFNLNLHQKLNKQNEDPNDTRYVLTDAAENVQEFKDIYYYLDNEGKKKYDKIVNGEEIELTPEDISVDYKGKLTYTPNEGVTVYEIFTELKTESGLTLKSELKGFRGADKIETRHEELAKVEEDIKGLERNIEDLTQSILDYGKLDCQAYIVLKEKQALLQKRSSELEEKSQQFFNTTKDIQNNLVTLNADYNATIRKGDASTGGLKITIGNVEVLESAVAEGNADGLNSWYTFVFDSAKSRFTYLDPLGKEMDRLSLLASYDGQYVAEHYGLDSSYAYDAIGEPITDYSNLNRSVTQTIKNARKITRVIQYLQEKFNAKCDKKAQAVRDTSSNLEQLNWTNQKVLSALKDELLFMQSEFQILKDEYDASEEAKTKEQYAVLKARAQIDLVVAENMLDYNKFVLEELIEQIPTNYVSDSSNIVYGFNKPGRLCAIMDSFENHVALLYDKGNLTSIIDKDEKKIMLEYTGEEGQKKLTAIIDAQDRRTEFEYGTGENIDYLVKIVYPNKDESVYSYENGLLAEAQSPAKIGFRLMYINNMPARIANITLLESINYEEVVKSTASTTEDIAEIIYSGTATDVFSQKTGIQTTYMFSPKGEWIGEHTMLSGISKSIKTYDVSNKRCNFTMQQTDFDNNIIDEATTHPISGNSITVEPNGSVNILSNQNTSECLAEWLIDVDSLPDYATDFVLSGFATADSAETVYRRKTEYCERFGHEHEDILVTEPHFELRAEVVYPSKTKIFVVSFDSGIKAKQFAAVPVTLDENEIGEPIKPETIKIIADYTNNQNTCRFAKPSFAKGDWAYAEFDGESRKVFECSNRNILDKTVDGVAVGKFVTYAEDFFKYDARGNMVQEKSVVIKDGIKKEYITIYEYDKQNRPIRTTAPSGMVSETIYDSKGNVKKAVSYHKSNPASKFVQEKEYSEKGQIIAEVDTSGENKTILEYIEGTNTVAATISPDGQKVVMGIDPHTDEVLAISSSINGEPNQTKLTHTKGMLTRLKSGGVAYDYTYDKWGRKTEVSIAGAKHVQFIYVENSNGQELATAIYANGEEYETVSDKFGKVLAINHTAYGAKEACIVNQYDAKDRLIKTIDYNANKVTEYTYKEDGSLKLVVEGDVRTITDNNAEGRVERAKYTLANIGEQIYQNTYNDEGMVATVTMPNGAVEKIDYDELGRVSEIEHPLHKERIYYYQSGDRATNIVTSVYQDNDRIKYNYDSNGNIKEIRENGKLAVRYGYDGLSRLIREDNVGFDKSFAYDYDTNGNILSKNIYPFTHEELTFGQEIVYGYCKVGNRDRLKSFGGLANEYDALGNATEYLGKRLKWSHLRNLVQFENIGFGYNAKGLRTDKTSRDARIKYYWAGDKLLAEKRTLPNCEVLELDDPYEAIYSNAEESVTMQYLYGASGITGFILKGETYYYRKNIQGDITHIIDESGELRAMYTYDAWGNHIIEQDAQRLGDQNPFRYRGYYYDRETGLYYLNSRYYDPEVGRFINADDITYLDPESINGLNLYAYCLNNPIMCSDSTGCKPTWWDSFWGLITKIVIGAVVVAGLAVLAVATAGTVFGVISVGAAVGSAIGFGVGGVTGGLANMATGGSFLQGFANGALSGSITGAISGAVGASPLGLLGQVGVGSLMGTGGYILGQAISGGSITVTGLIASAGLGALGGLLGGKGYMHGSSGIWVGQTIRQVTASVLLKSFMNESIIGFLSGGFGILDNFVFNWKWNKLN